MYFLKLFLEMDFLEKTLLLGEETPTANLLGEDLYPAGSRCLVACNYKPEIFHFVLLMTVPLN